MAKEDEEKTAFIMNQGIFFYTKMTFGLRNAEATYQRLVDKSFHKQIDRNLKVYIDDLVIKSRTEDEIVRDMEETFQTLREIYMKLNLKKCTFGIDEGMFLGYKVSSRGLKVCPNKVDAILSLPSPKCLKDVQNLNGKLASLNRFLSKSVEKSLPFFKTLKKCMKKSDFYWTTEAEEAFKQMKQLIAELPMLVTPMEKEELIVYLAAAKETVSAVLMTEREAKQMPIYFVSKVPRVSVKGQILEDFIVERPEEESPDTIMGEEEELPEPWILFDATNNEAKYEALIAGLKIAEQMGVKNLQANVDSRLVANQVNGTYVAKENNIVRYLEKHQQAFAHLSKQVLVEELKEKSISTVEVLAVVVEEEGDTWMTPIFKYLMDETLPAEVKKERAVKRKSWRPFPKGPGKVKFLIVAIDYFTKWIEAKPVATITGNQIKKFVWDNIVCRFGLPREIISDNGKQFQDNPFKDWCKNLCIGQHFASVKHPQTNGLVERANRSLGEGIKARLDERSKNWMEELPHVLWAHRTMIKSKKLGPKWEGPYEVTEALGKGAYKLRDRDGKQLPQTWNISNLKKCYVHQI
ncbi:reverse transcriptase domain-containing protein [Tanacetum coccineum]